LFLVYSWRGGLYITIIKNISISEIKNKREQNKGISFNEFSLSINTAEYRVTYLSLYLSLKMFSVR